MACGEEPAVPDEPEVIVRKVGCHEKERQTYQKGGPDGDFDIIIKGPAEKYKKIEPEQQKIDQDQPGKVGPDGEVAYPDMKLSIDKDRLEIKTESKTYHFKSKKSSSGEDNRSQLQDIIKSISNFYQQPE